MINPSDIKLHPMTCDIKGQRTHEQYVKDMARMFDIIKMDYRLDDWTIVQLLEYAQQVGPEGLYD